MCRLVLRLLVVGVRIAQADELDVGSWLAARGASADPEHSFNWQNAMCSEVAVGPHRETALECYEEEYVSRAIPGEAVPANRNVVHVLVRVVREKRVVTLIDVPVKTSSEARIWAALRADLEGRICRARGRYVWTKGLFSRSREGAGSGRLRPRRRQARRRCGSRLRRPLCVACTFGP